MKKGGNISRSEARGLLLLHRDDNILVVLGSIAKGGSFTIDGKEFIASDALEFGHKVARHTIAKGADVLKYGAPIGFAGTDIQQGEHVHLHNLVSRYTIIEDMES